MSYAGAKLRLAAGFNDYPCALAESLLRDSDRQQTTDNRQQTQEEMTMFATTRPHGGRTYDDLVSAKLTYLVQSRNKL